MSTLEERIRRRRSSPRKRKSAKKKSKKKSKKEKFEMKKKVDDMFGAAEAGEYDNYEDQFDDFF